MIPRLGGRSGPYILQLVEANEGRWAGTATQPQAALDSLAVESIRKAKTWTTRANTLSGKLTAIAPNLRAAGIDVVQERNGGKRSITITRQTEFFKNQSVNQRHDRHIVTQPEVNVDDDDDGDDELQAPSMMHPMVAKTLAT